MPARLLNVGEYRPAGLQPHPSQIFWKFAVLFSRPPHPSRIFQIFAVLFSRPVAPDPGVFSLPQQILKFLLPPVG